VHRVQEHRRAVESHAPAEHGHREGGPHHAPAEHGHREGGPHHAPAEEGRRRSGRARHAATSTVEGETAASNRGHSGHPSAERAGDLPSARRADATPLAEASAARRSRMRPLQRAEERTHAMPSIAAFAETAALVGDPARANMLASLMDGRALTATEL